MTQTIKYWESYLSEKSTIELHHFKRSLDFLKKDIIFEKEFHASGLFLLNKVAEKVLEKRKIEDIEVK